MVYKKFRKRAEFLVGKSPVKDTKNSTFMGVSILLIVGTKTNSAFKYSLYKRLQTVVRTEIVFYKVNLIIFTLSLPLPYCFFMQWLYRRNEIQAKSHILRHFYIAPISSKILTTKYPLRSTFNRKLLRYPLQVRRQTFKFENNFSTVEKSFLNLVKLWSLVAEYWKMSKILWCKVCEFCILLYYAGKTVTTFPHSGNAFPCVIQKYTREMRSIMGRARAGYGGISILLRDIFSKNASISKCPRKWMWMKTPLVKDIVLVLTAENRDFQKRWIRH